MDTTQPQVVVSKTDTSNDYRKWRKSDTVWMLGLYGTAIGAGVLFLPINAGIGGVVPRFIIPRRAFPTSLFAHSGLCRVRRLGIKFGGENI